MITSFSDFPRDYLIQIIGSLDHHSPDDFTKGQVHIIALLNDKFDLGISPILGRFEAYRNRTTAGANNV